MTYFLQPFDYRTDGVFGRPGTAWYEDSDGLIHSAAADARRVVDRAGVRWIWIEGPRENFIVDGTDLTQPSWDAPALGSGSVVDPQGNTAFVAVIAGGDIINQTFTAVVSAVKVAASVYTQSLGGAGTVDGSIVNGVPGAPSSMTSDDPPPSWRRGFVPPSDMSAAGPKLLELANATVDSYLWGAVVEAGPTLLSDALFASQPILDLVARAAEYFEPGAITQAQINRVPTHLRITFEPEYDSAAVIGPIDEFVLAYCQLGSDLTSLYLRLETTASQVRARVGSSLTSAASGALTFSRGQALTFTLELATGTLTVAGATAGNGAFSNGTYALHTGDGVFIGHDPNKQRHAFGLLSPLLIGFAPVTADSIDQVALNAAAVRFSEAVLMFDPRGETDALNVANYDLSGSIGIPGLQCVLRGSDDEEVVLYFDGEVPQNALVRVLVHDVVAAGVPVGVLPTTLSFTAYGPEHASPAIREITYPRVDIDNPQTPDDAPQGAPLGTIPITDTGDLGNVSGRAYLRKRIFRRLATMRDGFVLLENYGLRPTSKGLVRPSEMRRLQTDAEAQVRAEPGVVAVRASVTEVKPGLVALLLVVTDDEGSFEMVGQVDFSEE